MLISKSLTTVEWRGEIFPCQHGRNGFANDKREGDGCTPRGTFFIEEVWYRPDRVDLPVLDLPVRGITPQDGWCDDPESPFYNQWVALPFAGSHELLWREDYVYDIVIVTSHNRYPVIPEKGSAIFIHCARFDEAENLLPTAGCLSLKKDDLLKILEEVNRETAWKVP